MSVIFPLTFVFLSLWLVVYLCAPPFVCFNFLATPFKTQAHASHTQEDSNFSSSVLPACEIFLLPLSLPHRLSHSFSEAVASARALVGLAVRCFPSLSCLRSSGAKSPQLILGEKVNSRVSKRSMGGHSESPDCVALYPSLMSQGDRLDQPVSPVSHASVHHLLFCWTSNPYHLKPKHTKPQT